MHYFHKIQNVVLILSQHSQEQIARELLLRQFFLFRFLFLSLSRSTLLVSCSLSALSLSRSICSSDGPSIPLSFPHSVSADLLLSLSLSFSHNHSLARSDSLLSLSLSHSLNHPIRITSYLFFSLSHFSLPLSYCLFLPIFSICGVLSTYKCTCCGMQNTSHFSQFSQNESFLLNNTIFT